MTDNVVSIHGAEISNARREAFMRAVAASFDIYVEARGEEPEALVYVLCGVKQPSQIGWDVHGESRAGVTSVLSLAATHCLSEAAPPRQEIFDR